MREKCKQLYIFSLPCTGEVHNILFEQVFHYFAILVSHLSVTELNKRDTSGVVDPKPTIKSQKTLKFKIQRNQRTEKAVQQMVDLGNTSAI